MEKKWWGCVDDKDIYLFRLSNGRITITVTNYGCAITSIAVPGTDGRSREVVLGYDSLDGYLGDPFYMGAVVGRFAGRIANGSFRLQDRLFTLAINELSGNNHLHGGHNGFNKKVFQPVAERWDQQTVAVDFFYRSMDLEEGYPGNLDLKISYQLTAAGEITIGYEAVSDRTTHLNLTNHSYFNLSGSTETALEQELFIDADTYIDTAKNWIPTGRLNPVSHTRYDFRNQRQIDAVGGSETGLRFNACFVLNNKGVPNARLYDPRSGIGMTIITSFPGILLYTGDYLAGKFASNQGVCLETQFFPDTPNQPLFPSTILHPEQPFNHHTILQFYQQPSLDSV